jgi:rRNA maturation endonuclease Nob1
MAEVREIREKKSVEWAALSLEQRNLEVKKGAKQMQMRVEEIRKKAGVPNNRQDCIAVEMK